MHELSICESIVNTLKSQAEAHQFSRVLVLQLDIGQFAGVEIESLRFCFPVVALGTLAEEAELKINLVPGRGWCETCQRLTDMQARYSSCDLCGSSGLTLSTGGEMRIAEVEVE
ncbi:hydrogenase maturation nickel metallochaperone HypA [Enterovibrio nigricans]|uniref:Hydrogenase maturation factor HypA n=1 Tax=Enterovibrio nigricans DSM 22720 TaxID=1121868 RepID=A0A1T4UYY3_9GAMM|nr:hydrogenase maturation nickel metallochaperone HypA [Enterovibrio nigricans]PKF50083.1 hydrogenase maturation nickel metallochaperone HypA [Enterovibrio nigricans]SKA57846.1 hydrogenase nickel incorporation protein HypA/HybF [Enterovibrio nigricans DSM 22720]